MKKKISYYLQKFAIWVKRKSNALLNFLILKPNPKESIIQYIIRSIIIPDSLGNPSWTMTLTAIIMAYMGIFIGVEYSLAFTKVYTYDPATGKVISDTYRGISSYAWVAMITLLGSVVFFIKFRDQRYSNKNNGNASTLIEPTIPTEESESKDSAIQSMLGTVSDVVDTIEKVKK
jgi:hypothetical protein